MWDRGSGDRARARGIVSVGFDVREGLSRGRGWTVEARSRARGASGDGSGDSRDGGRTARGSDGARTGIANWQDGDRLGSGLSVYPKSRLRRSSVLERGMRLRGPRESPEHEMDRRDADHRLAGVLAALVVAAEPTRAHQPGERALHDPASMQDDETALPRGASDDLDPPGRLEFCDPCLEGRVVVLLIGPDHLQTRQRVASSWASWSLSLHGWSIVETPLINRGFILV